MERAVLLAFLCLIGSVAYAGEWSLLINGHAQHLEKSPKQKNEANYGIGLQYDTPRDNHWITFGFGSELEDSRENVSLNVGGGIRRRYWVPWLNHMHVDFGGAALLMTRETYNDGRPFPAVLPVVSMGGERVALNITYVPEVDPRIIPLVFFQLKYKLD